MRSRKVAQKLIHLIESGDVAVGDALPPTRVLASRFGVSLGTVQVAMRELEMLHMLECRPRQRPVVKASSPASEQVRRQVRQVAIVVPVPPNVSTLPNMLMPWTTQIVHAMEQSLFETNYATGLVSIPNEPDAEAKVMARLDLFGSSLAGVLCFPNHLGPAMIPQPDKLERRRLPWVCINRPGPDFSHNYVSAEHQKAGRKVGRLFVECGFRRVILLAHGVKVQSSDFEKITGFFQAYLEKGVSTQGLETVSCQGWEEAHGYRVMAEWLARKQERPQAIFATGDYLAMGAMRAVREAGLSIPDDVSIVGATGLPGSQTLQPPLSVVVQPMAEIGRTAALLLNEMISEGIMRCARRRIPCKFILRESLKLPEALRRKLENDEQLLEITSDESRNDTV